MIYVQSYKTAIIMGAARGAAVLTAAEHGLPIYEYAPKRVKQAVVGKGAAAESSLAWRRFPTAKPQSPSLNPSQKIRANSRH